VEVTASAVTVADGQFVDPARREAGTAHLGAWSFPDGYISMNPLELAREW